MPNHVYHTMIVWGAPEQLDALYTKLGPVPYDVDPTRLCFNLFQSFKPMPEAVRSTVSEIRDGQKVLYPDVKREYGVNDWLEWANENWKTRWGTYDTHIVHEDGRLVLTFSTAWNSPHEFYREHLGNLRFRYRAHEESSERLIMGDNDRVVEIVPSARVQLFLRFWAADHGRAEEQYIAGEGEGQYFDFFALSHDWMEDIRREKGI